MDETEGEMVGCHHQLDGHEFEKAVRVGDGQRSLACCSPWGHKDSNMTEWLSWTELIIFISNFLILTLLLKLLFPCWTFTKNSQLKAYFVKHIMTPYSSISHYFISLSKWLILDLSNWYFLWKKEKMVHHLSVLFVVE